MHGNQSTSPANAHNTVHANDYRYFEEINELAQDNVTVDKKTNTAATASEKEIRREGWARTT